MALGKKLDVFNYQDMIRGASSSDTVSDAGFSPTTTGVNLTYNPGSYYQPDIPVDKSTGLTGAMIASTQGTNGVNSGYPRVFLSADSSQDGRWWSINGSYVVTQRGTNDATSNYVQGKSDMINYQGEIYTTGDQYIVRWSDVGGADTFNYTFYHFTDSLGTATLVPHPALVYEDNAFYGNGNVLLKQTSAGGAPAVVLTLSVGMVIVALGVDAGSGNMLISVIGEINLSDQVNSLARVLYYDGFSNKASKVVQVEEMVTAFPSSEGATYCAYGNNLGYWNGAGVRFLRKFSDIGYDSTQLFYKQHFTNIGSTLYFLVRNTVWAHGPVHQGGQHVFYPTVYISAALNKDLTHVANVGSGNLVFSYATSSFFSWSSTTVTSGIQVTFNSNQYEFQNLNDGAWVRRVRIYWKDTVANGANPGDIYFYNENGLITNIGDSGAFSLANSSGSAKGMTEILIGGGTGLRVYQLRWQIRHTTLNPGIQRVEIFGDPANQ